MTEKLTFLQDNHFSEWLQMRQCVKEEISSKQDIMCVCGRLATGLHEMNCRKLSNKVTGETVKRLKHLLTS